MDITYVRTYGTNYKKNDANVRSSVCFIPVVYVRALDKKPVSTMSYTCGCESLTS